MSLQRHATPWHDTSWTCPFIATQTAAAAAAAAVANKLKISPGHKATLLYVVFGI